MNQLIDQLKWRYATKQFDPSKKIDAATWSTIEESLVLTPSSFGLQPWKFIVITSAELKAQLLPHSWHQAQVTDCSHFVVLCAKETVSHEDIDAFLESIVATRGGSIEDLKGYGDMMRGFTDRMDADAKLAWAKNQVYIALGQLMTTAAMLGVDACPMEGIIPAEYDKLIQEDGYVTTVACALGYRSDEDKYATAEKVRYSNTEMISTRA